MNTIIVGWSMQGRRLRWDARMTSSLREMREAAKVRTEANRRYWRAHPRARYIRLAAVLSWAGLAAVFGFLFAFPFLGSISIVGVFIAVFGLIPAGVGILTYALMPDLRQGLTRKT